MATKAKANKAVRNSDSRRTRARRMSPEARRAQLLSCAIRVFAKKGISAGVHADVAELAKVSVPTTFHYFPTSEDLVNSVLKEIHRFLMDEMVNPHLSAKTNAVESIEDILVTFDDAIDSHQDYIRVWLEWSVSIRGEMWQNYLKFYRDAIGGVKSIIKRGIKDGSIKKDLDVEDGARGVIALAHMVAQLRFANSSRESIHHTIHSLVFGYFSSKSLT